MLSTDLLTAALHRPAQRFDPLSATSFGGTRPPSVMIDLHRRAIREVHEAYDTNPEYTGLTERQRVELSLPARLMSPWAEACNQPWTGPRDVKLMEEIWRSFEIEQGTYLLGVRAPDAFGQHNDRRKVWKRTEKEAIDLTNPLLTGPVAKRPSHLTGFLTCSFFWQKLVEDGKLELIEGSVFHRAWSALADVVAKNNTMEVLTKARKSALKRVEPMLAQLNERGYYQ